MKNPTPRRTRVLRIFATLAFATLIVFGPLTENTGAEKLFATAVIGLALLTLLFASARIAFSLIAVSLLFGAIEIAGVLKFRYLTTPLLAPDLEYFVNGMLVYTDSTIGSTTQFNNIILQGYNAGNAYSIYWDNLQTDSAMVPEPASLAIWSLIGVAGAAGAWRRKRKQSSAS